MGRDWVGHSSTKSISLSLAHHFVCIDFTKQITIMYISYWLNTSSFVLMPWKMWFNAELTLTNASTKPKQPIKFLKWDLCKRGKIPKHILCIFVSWRLSPFEKDKSFSVLTLYTSSSIALFERINTASSLRQTVQLCQVSFSFKKYTLKVAPFYYW